jgi:hypothetical protein
MKDVFVCFLSPLLVTQTVIARSPESPSCSQPKIDATTSSVRVSVEPSTTQFRQTVSLADHKGLVCPVSLLQGTALVAVQVAGGLNNKIMVMLLDLPNYQLYQAHQKYSFFKA